MLDQLKRVVERRKRLLHIRQLQQDRAQQALSVVLAKENELLEQRATLEDARTDTHSRLLGEFDGQDAHSDDLVIYAQQIETFHRLIEGKEGEIVALQPEIQAGREEVVKRFKQKRSMEVLTERSQERFTHEELRSEQKTLDDLTSQRHRARNAYNG